MTADNPVKAVEHMYPPRTLVCSASYARYAKEHADNVDFFMFVVSLTARADETAGIAIKALATNGSAEDMRKLREWEVNSNPAQKRLNRYSTLLSRNLTNAVVSGYQRYFSEILQEVALKRPEVIRSSATVRADEVLQFSKHKDLVAYLIDKRLNELAYGGLKQTEAYFRDHLGVELFDNDRERDLLGLFNEIRNINLHNGSLVNRLFLSRVRLVDGFRLKLGQRCHVDMDRFLVLTDNAIRVTARLDKAICEKFALRRKSIRSWLATRRASNSEAEPDQESK